MKYQYNYPMRLVFGDFKCNDVVLLKVSGGRLGLVWLGKISSVALHIKRRRYV